GLKIKLLTRSGQPIFAKYLEQFRGLPYGHVKRQTPWEQAPCWRMHGTHRSGSYTTNEPALTENSLKKRYWPKKRRSRLTIRIYCSILALSTAPSQARLIKP